MQKQQRTIGNWAELPEDLLVLAANQLSLLEDFLSFSGVCRSWRSIATKENFKGSEQIPWLMLSDKDKPNEHQFVSLRKHGIIRTVNLPEVRGKRCLETLGWLVTISQNGSINLLHPFTRVQISLPHITTLQYYHVSEKSNHLRFIHKAVLSSRPEEGEDYALVVIYASSRRLALWRPEDRSWNAILPPLCGFADIILDKGQCCGIMRARGEVVSINVVRPNPTLPLHVLVLDRFPCITSIEHKKLYVAESEGKFLMVVQMFREVSLPIFSAYDPLISDFKVESSARYRTCGFKVFEVTLARTGECVEKLSLGENALFLGDNATVSVAASRFSGIKANSIYYTDRRELGKDTGVYNMEDGSLRPCYDVESLNLIDPPLWVHSSSV